MESYIWHILGVGLNPKWEYLHFLWEYNLLMNHCRSAKSDRPFGSKLPPNVDLFFSPSFSLLLPSLSFLHRPLPTSPLSFYPSISCRKVTCRTVTVKWPASCRTPSEGTVAPPCSSAALPPATTTRRPSQLWCSDNGKYICGNSQCGFGNKL